MAVSFSRLCGLEPKLKNLHRAASLLKHDRENAPFFWSCLFMPTLMLLVGWFRWGNPEVLKTSEAWDACYKHIYDELFEG